MSQTLDMTRRAATAGLLFTGYAGAALAKEAHPITTPGDGLVTDTVILPAPDGFALPAYVARPEGEGPFPVVIVVCEIFGVHAYIMDICRRLAKQGYAAVAPAFFNRVEDPARIQDMSRIMQIVGAAGYEQVMGDVSAALDWSSQQLWAQGDRMGITGWCWGGKVVWQACARFATLKSGVAWYGRLAPAADASEAQIASGQPWPVNLAEDLKAPVLGLYGGADTGIPLSSVETMRQALQRAGQTGSRIEVYDGAPHGFHADYRDSYTPAAATDAWGKAVAFFNATLKG